MELLFRQRLFSWLDSYDVFDREGNTVYTVKGELSWGHRLQIYDAGGWHLGTVQEKVLAWLPRFELYSGGRLVGTLTKELSLLRPKFRLDCNGWRVEGDVWEWDYRVMEGSFQVSSLTKKLWNWTDTYRMEIARPEDALLCLMIILSIDAAKCSQGS